MLAAAQRCASELANILYAVAGPISRMKQDEAHI